MLPHQLAALLDTNKQATPQLIEPPTIIGEAIVAQNSTEMTADSMRVMADLRDERRGIAKRDRELIARLVVISQNSPKRTADIIRDMVEVRDERRTIAKRDKELIAEWDELKVQLLAKMREQGDDINSISSKSHSATRTVDQVPVVDDWDMFYDWLWKTRSWHLMQRRIAVGAFREMIESGQEIPGLRTTEKVDISLTAR